MSNKNGLTSTPGVFYTGNSDSNIYLRDGAGVVITEPVITPNATFQNTDNNVAEVGFDSQFGADVFGIASYAGVKILPRGNLFPGLNVTSNANATTISSTSGILSVYGQPTLNNVGVIDFASSSGQGVPASWAGQITTIVLNDTTAPFDGTYTLNFTSSVGSYKAGSLFTIYFTTPSGQNTKLALGVTGGLVTYNCSAGDMLKVEVFYDGTSVYNVTPAIPV